METSSEVRRQADRGAYVPPPFEVLSGSDGPVLRLNLEPGQFGREVDLAVTTMNTWASRRSNG
jgi:hypothetical protein